MPLDHTNNGFFQLMATRTAAEMDRAFECYYPVEGDNDVSEAVTTAYLAFQLRDEGFFVYPQIQCSAAIDNHLDLAAINPVSNTVFLVESKRLYSSEKARSLGKDWRRLQAATITSELRHVPDGHRYFACLLATTWNESFGNWWGDLARSAAPGRCNANDWIDLRNALGQASLNLCLNVPLDRLGWNNRLYVLFSFIGLRQASQSCNVV